MKLLVDVDKLEADGTITPTQAQQLRRAAASDTGTLAINVIATIGAFAVDRRPAGNEADERAGGRGRSQPNSRRARWCASTARRSLDFSARHWS